MYCLLKTKPLSLSKKMLWHLGNKILEITQFSGYETCRILCLIYTEFSMYVHVTQQKTVAGK